MNPLIMTTRNLYINICSCSPLFIGSHSFTSLWPQNWPVDCSSINVSLCRWNMTLFFLLASFPNHNSLHFFRYSYIFSHLFYSSICYSFVVVPLFLHSYYNYHYLVYHLYPSSTTIIIIIQLLYLSTYTTS
jgi:hypothetical protein